MDPSTTQLLRIREAFAPLRMTPLEEGLDLYVGAEGWDHYRSSVAVVAGAYDVLQTGGQIDAAPGVRGI